MKLFIVIVFVLIGSNSLVAQKNLFQLRAELSVPNNNSLQVQDVTSINKKSGFTAVLYSLMLPGMGELYADGFDEGQYSLIAEGGLWLTYFSFQQYGNWLQTDARNFRRSVLNATAAIRGGSAKEWWQNCYVANRKCD